MTDFQGDWHYFLSSLESTRFEPVRERTLLRTPRFPSGKECALVRVEPAVPGQDFGQGNDLEVLLLVARHEGGRLFPTPEFPCFVFICRIDEAKQSSDVVATDDVQIIAWGELYRTKDDARVYRLK